MSAEVKLCERCGDDQCWRDEVDVEVGIIYGPWGCPTCGWCEDPEYDCSDGPAAATGDGYVADQFGGLTPAAGPGTVPVPDVPTRPAGGQDDW